MSHLYSAFTDIYSLLIEKDLCEGQLGFHVFICASHPEISSFISVRVSPTFVTPRQFVN